MKQKIKNILKIVVCSTLYYSGLIRLFIRLYLMKRSNLPVIILIYHRITENITNEINQELTMNHLLENFTKEMRFIKRYFSVVSMDAAVELIKNNKAPRKPTFAITFDDGFEDNHRLAFPVLKELDIPATIFLTAAYVGTDELPWVEKVGEAIRYTDKKSLRLNSVFSGAVYKLDTLKDRRLAFNEITTQLKDVSYSQRISIIEDIVSDLGRPQNTPMRMLNWQAAVEMSGYGIAFGAHTMTHPILSKVPLAMAQKEIFNSKLRIEEKTGTKVKHFAFPNGRPQDFSEELKEYCKEIGFKSVSTAVYGNNKLGQDAYALKRISPGKTMPIFAVDLIRGFLCHCEEPSTGRRGDEAI